MYKRSIDHDLVALLRQLSLNFEQNEILNTDQKKLQFVIYLLYTSSRKEGKNGEDVQNDA